MSSPSLLWSWDLESSFLLCGRAQIPSGRARTFYFLARTFEATVENVWHALVNAETADWPLVADKDSCKGDSGAPLVYRSVPNMPWYLVGLVSYGTDPCGIGKPGVYTKIDVYLDWISQTIKEWNQTEDELQNHFSIMCVSYDTTKQ